MLRSTKDLRGFTLRATNGEIGSVDEFLFDDEQWTIRYMVANTGGWLTGRLVLISPIVLGNADWEAKTLAVALTRAQIEQSPDIATDQPVSRQREAELAEYYGYLPYWGGMGIWGAGMSPYALGGIVTPPVVPPVGTTATERALAGAETQRGDQHLRSTREVTGYRIHARDGEIGHVDDFILDDETWAIRYMVIDTRNLWPGKHVLVAPEWIGDVHWSTSTVDVDLLRETIKQGPEYDPAMLNRAYETALYRNYGRPGYWETPR
jgi:hypothetical protein